MNTAGSLTLTSDHYHSKQQNFSAGASIPVYGYGTVSASVNAGQETIRSDADSVAQQTGIFAGSGGFHIRAGRHTQLNGAAVAGTITGAGNNSGYAASITYAAVSDGQIIIRNQENQRQSLSELNRDTEHAANALSPVFNKEKEQKRLQTVQLLGEISGQITEISRNYGKIQAHKENIAASQRGNNSSNFKAHVTKENELTGKWNDTNQAYNYPKLKDGLNFQNLDRIAKQDYRLNRVINGSNGQKNYGIGLVLSRMPIE